MTSVFDEIDAELAKRPDVDPLHGQAVNDRRRDDKSESAGIEAAHETVGETETKSAEWTCVGDVEPEEVTWLWPRRIPIAKVSLFAGDPGLGKSFVTLDMGARVTRGVPFPDTQGTPNSVGSVVVLSAEDDIPDTIRPRLDAAGADSMKVHVLKAIRTLDAETGESAVRGFELTRDIRVLDQQIAELSDCRLVIIGPISAYLGSRLDSHVNTQVRAVLALLAELASRHHVAVVAVTHLNKGAGNSAMYRTMGSLAFVAAARAVWVITKDKDDPKRRLMLPIKCNLSADDETGLAYRLQPCPIAPHLAYVKWEADPVHIDVNEALAPETRGQDRSERESAKQWLRDALADGRMDSTKLKAEAKANCISDATLRRAKDDFGVVATRDGFGSDGKWFWSLPPKDDQRAKDTHSQKGEHL